MPDQKGMGNHDMVQLAGNSENSSSSQTTSMEWGLQPEVPGAALGFTYDRFAEQILNEVWERLLNGSAGEIERFV